MVEFALIVTLLCLLLVGTVDFGRAFFFDVLVGGAALEGARAAAAGAPDNDSNTGGYVAGVTTIVRNSAGAVLGPQLTISVSPSQAVRASATGVGQCTPSTCAWATVTAQYSFQPLTPWMRQIMGNTVLINTTVSQRMRTQCALADGTLCS